MIRRPRVKRAMERARIVEIAITPIDWQGRRGNVDKAGSGPAPLNLISLTGNDDDRLVSKPRTSAQFRLDIGSDAAAQGRIKSADVDNPHRSA